jgi:pimeloyl-ACP methyl ester carboxylesterase
MDIAQTAAVIEELAERLFEVRRRSDTYFERAPLALPALGALDSLARAQAHALVQAVAGAAGIGMRNRVGAADGPVELVLSECLLRAPWEPGGLAADWRELVGARVTARLAAHGAVQAPCFQALPGLERRVTPDGRTHYLRCGRGGPALLLVNAFGLGLDVWQDLVARLSVHFTVLTLDDEPQTPPGGVPRTSYATADWLQHFEAAARAMLADAGHGSCHVLCWCSGAKGGVELARRWPGGVRSLLLFAPSFAGASGDAGADSSFEANLFTMCKLVDRMPQSAESLARSMMALMSKGAEGDNPYAVADQVMLPWLWAPFASGANMVEYSRQLLNFRAHQLAPQADAGPLELPVLLVTGEFDSTTSSERAREVCGTLLRALHFELRAGSHYFIHQNSELMAQMVTTFVTQGAQARIDHPRLRPLAPVADLVSGEL